MSLSVSGSNSNSIQAYWQSLQQQNSSQAGTAAPSDPLSQLLATLGQGSGATSPGTGAASSAAGTSGGSSSQLDPQTLQALFSLQANSSTSQSLMSQLDGGTSADPSDSTSGPQAQQTQGQSGHHRHHHMVGANGGSAADDTSSSSSSSGGGANGSNSNLIEQLMQMQAQLVNPATTQSIATA